MCFTHSWSCGEFDPHDAETDPSLELGPCLGLWAHQVAQGLCSWRAEPLYFQTFSDESACVGVLGALPMVGRLDRGSQ